MNVPAWSEPTAAEAPADSAGTESKNWGEGDKRPKWIPAVQDLRDPARKTDQLDETAKRQGINVAASVTAQKRSTGAGGRDSQKAEGQWRFFWLKYSSLKKNSVLTKSPG